MVPTVPLGALQGSGIHGTLAFLSITVALVSVPFQFANFWELSRGMEPLFITILHFVIYSKRPLGVSSCILTFIMFAI